MNASKTFLTGAAMALAAGMSLIAHSSPAQAYGSGYGWSSGSKAKAAVVAQNEHLVIKKEIRDGETVWCEYWKDELRGCESRSSDLFSQWRVRTCLSH